MLAELEHMNANFLRAMRQYEDLRSAPPPGQARELYSLLYTSIKC